MTTVGEVWSAVYNYIYLKTCEEHCSILLITNDLFYNCAVALSQYLMCCLSSVTKCTVSRTVHNHATETPNIMAVIMMPTIPSHMPLCPLWRHHPSLLCLSAVERSCTRGVPEVYQRCTTEQNCTDHPGEWWLHWSYWTFRWYQTDWVLSRWQETTL